MEAKKFFLSSGVKALRDHIKNIQRKEPPKKSSKEELLDIVFNNRRVDLSDYGKLIDLPPSMAEGDQNTSGQIATKSSLSEKISSRKKSEVDKKPRGKIATTQSAAPQPAATISTRSAATSPAPNIGDGCHVCN
jgi:hypothetical protein